MKFGFVAKHRGAWPVNQMCEALGVSRGGFYAWLARPRSCRSLSDEVIGAQVRHSFVASDRTYGARRVWRDVLEMGHNCGLHRIERLMREQALRARPKRRGLPKDRGERSVVADNVLERQFHADAANQKWVADFTYIWTAEGWLYVAAVLDLYSRRIVGWSMQQSMTSQLVVDALMMAVWRRGRPVALLHHSDQGSQYTSTQFQQLLKEQGITCSMSRAGEVWDNSAMESFFSSLKTERTARKVYRSREQARPPAGGLAIGPMDRREDLAAALIGAAALGDAPPYLLAAVNALAAGALLTMIADTMIPEAVEGERGETGLLVTLGFLVAFALSHLGAAA